MKPPLIINYRCRTPFGAALSLFTEVAYRNNVLQSRYPVVLDGVEYESAGKAYHELGKGLSCEDQFELLLKILTAKLEQHELLPPTIALSGGIEWLRTCSYQSPIQPVSFWDGKGYNSAFITALTVAYRQVNRQLLAERGIDDDDVISEDLADPASEPEHSDRQNLSKLVAYDSTIQELYIVFNQREKAVEWLKNLKVIDVGAGYSIEESLRQDWRFELVVSVVKKETAIKLAANYRFDLNPNHNLNQLLNAEKLPAAVAGK